MSTIDITTKAKEIIRLQKVIAKAEAALAEAKGELLNAIDTDKVEVDGITVTVVRPTKRTVDLTDLRTILGPKKFGKVTRTAIDWKSFDILASLGDIPAEARKSVVTTEATPYVKVAAR
jgi:hypothetical protein